MDYLFKSVLRIEVKLAKEYGKGYYKMQTPRDIAKGIWWASGIGDDDLRKLEKAFSRYEERRM